MDAVHHVGHQVHLFLVLPEKGGLGSESLPPQDLAAQQPELPITHHRHARVWRAGRYHALLHDAAGCSKGLHEDSLLVGERVRHLMQVGHRERNVLCHGPVLVQDAKDGAGGAVVAGAVALEAARAARPAGEVDVPAHALADEIRGGGGRFLHHPNKLVADNPLEAHVPLDDLEVGIANTCGQNTNDSLPLRWGGSGGVRD
mmetsp:Transcript_19824/g.63067  ORF Transcript_19824/g.63067 Transcript_19824/m.63067 type:complete len:201 (-) Transcript_19824:81-683(-)